MNIQYCAEYEWDEAKREENLRKHGVDFAAMKHFEWDTAMVEQSDRHGEIRFTGVGYMGGRFASSRVHRAWRHHAHNQLAQGRRRRGEKICSN